MMVFTYASKYKIYLLVTVMQTDTRFYRNYKFLDIYNYNTGVSIAYCVLHYCRFNILEYKRNYSRKM